MLANSCEYSGGTVTPAFRISKDTKLVSAIWSALVGWRGLVIVDESQLKRVGEVVGRKLFEGRGREEMRKDHAEGLNVPRFKRERKRDSVEEWVWGWGWGEAGFVVIVVVKGVVRRWNRVRRRVGGRVWGLCCCCCCCCGAAVMWSLRGEGVGDGWRVIVSGPV